VRLSEMVELAPFYIMLLSGPALIVEAINPNYTRLLEGREVLGRTLDEVFDEPEIADLVALVRESYKRNMSHTTQMMPIHVSDGHGQPVGRHFAYTLVPTHDSEGKGHGIVVYAEDVTALMAREAEERRWKLKLMVEHAEQV